MKSNVLKKVSAGLLSAAMLLTLAPAPAFAKTVKTPPQVSILAPKLVGKTKVKIQWLKAKNTSKYRVYYKVKGKNWSSVNVSGKKESYTTKSLGFSKTIYVKVAGLNGRVKGKASETRSIDTAGKGPYYLYTAEGKKVYVGKTYDTSYWDDNDSHRTIKVTYIPEIKTHKSGLYDGGYYLTGIDVKNGGVYTCAVCTKKNINYKKYSKGIYCDNVEYQSFAKVYSSGKDKGDREREDPAKLGNGAISWLDNGWQAKQLTILKDNVTVVETIDGTEPTLDHYHSKWTKASTNGESFSTYKWGMGEAADGTVWSRATRWIRVYQGNKLIVDSIHHLYSWDE